jgi:polyisoprenyl-phosphate glycosyltransferase
VTTTSSHGPTVAVVVPCHNEAGYIDALLDRLLPQVAGAPNWRVVLIDDASTDATAELLAAANASPQVAVVSGTFGSPGGARSAGVAVADAAQVDWIVTVDADVTLTPSVLSTGRKISTICLPPFRTHVS